MDLEALIFTVMSMRLSAADEAISGQIDEMRARLAVKDAYRARIQELQTMVGEHTDGHYVIPPTGFDPRKLEFTVDEDGEVASFSEDGALPVGTGEHDGNFLVDDLHHEIDRLQTRLDALNSDSEVAMIRLNQDVSRRQQITTLCSNMMSNFHNTAMAAINNIK